MKIEIKNKIYNVLVATTEEDRIKGLLNVIELDDDEGMLFIYEEPLTVGMWMKDTLIPLDIIFINEDEEVISVYKGKPKDSTIAEEDNVKFVLEISPNSGIKEGDEIDIDYDEDSPVMEILDKKGNVLGTIESGSRIISRIESKVLIRKVKKANRTKLDSDYKAVGKYMFKILDGLDKRDVEYVSVGK